MKFTMGMNLTILIFCLLINVGIFVLQITVFENRLMTILGALMIFACLVGIAFHFKLKWAKY
jgi:hypothetical protein